MLEPTVIAMTTLSGPELEQGWIGPAAGQPTGAGWRWLRRLGSLRVALGVLALLLAGVIWAYRAGGAGIWPVVIPLGLSSVNLLAAIAVHPAFRRHTALLVFHLALLAIVVLAALGRMTYLTGRAELAEGQTFRGRLAGWEAGPWHPWGIRDVRFRNEGFSIDYLPGRRRDHTRNRVRYVDGQGRERAVVIGDQVPLELDGYRFYTSFNKGFALTFRWEPRGGAPQRGTVHLPAFPLNEYRQANTWTPEGASHPVWIQLQFDEPLLDPAAPARFRTPGSHRVVVRVEERREVLTPGQGLTVDGGRLTYEGIGTWMGYRVFYDWTKPWLLAACAVAAVSLGWHFWRRFAARPWWQGAGLEGT